ncbi:MAG: HAMP domain-containing sensor histidine kinase [Hyphomicrobium sp.]|uniref:sensor histidine kinase n=1 Tax=Hyphomicrobium sp. TaxID=82 RepID=UPI0039E30452
MAVAAKPAMLTDGAEASTPDSARDTQALVAVDPETAEILSANAEGSAALGLFSYATFPIALDPAMPAVARLRQIASTGSVGKGDVETLLFWRSGQLKRVKCKITQGKGRDRKVLILHIETVEAPDEALRRREHGPSSPPNKDKAAGVSSPVSNTLDPDVIAKLAHELKTPLTAIAVAAEIMRDERLGEMKNARYLSYAADIHESATHALDVIAALLSERAKTAAPASRLIAIDLNAIAERTVSSVKALAESCGLNLSFDAGGRKPYVIANPTALRQILLNLLTNAIKFTPAGGDVCIATGLMDDGRVFLTVRDTGRGITEPGATSGAGAQSAAELQLAWARGHGIGLPLVEALVRDMGADIAFDSAPQKGTTATILFGDFTQRFK